MSSPSRSRRRRALQERTRCPDCRSNVRVVAERGASGAVEVFHDDTCPYWRAHGARRFIQIRVAPLEADQ